MTDDNNNNRSSWSPVSWIKREPWFSIPIPDQELAAAINIPALLAKEWQKLDRALCEDPCRIPFGCLHIYPISFSEENTCYRDDLPIERWLWCYGNYVAVLFVTQTSDALLGVGLVLTRDLAHAPAGTRGLGQFLKRVTCCPEPSDITFDQRLVRWQSDALIYLDVRLTYQNEETITLEDVEKTFRHELDQFVALCHQMAQDIRNRDVGVARERGLTMYGRRIDPARAEDRVLDLKNRRALLYFIFSLRDVTAQTVYARVYELLVRCLCDVRWPHHILLGQLLPRVMRTGGSGIDIQTQPLHPFVDPLLHIESRNGTQPTDLPSSADPGNIIRAAMRRFQKTYPNHSLPSDWMWWISQSVMTMSFFPENLSVGYPTEDNRRLLSYADIPSLLGVVAAQSIRIGLNTLSQWPGQSLLDVLVQTNKQEPANSSLATVIDEARIALRHFGDNPPPPPPLLSQHQDPELSDTRQQIRELSDQIIDSGRAQEYIETVAFGTPGNRQGSRLLFRDGHLNINLTGPKAGWWSAHSQGNRGGKNLASLTQLGIYLENHQSSISARGDQVLDAAFKEQLLPETNTTLRAYQTSNSVRLTLERMKHFLETPVRESLLSSPHPMAARKASASALLRDDQIKAIFDKSSWIPANDPAGPVVRYVREVRKFTEQELPRIYFEDSPYLRQCRSLFFDVERRDLPALIHLAIDSNGHCPSLQRTYLDPLKGFAKAGKGNAGKKSLGPRGDSFFLVQPGVPLDQFPYVFLAEGLETAWSFAAVCRAFRVYHAAGKEFMKRFTLDQRRQADVIRRVQSWPILCLVVDNDKSTLNSLDPLALPTGMCDTVKYLETQQGWTVRWVRPYIGFKDFDDLRREHGMGGPIFSLPSDLYTVSVTYPLISHPNPPGWGESREACAKRLFAMK
jgi:hypothetical protein